MGSLIAKRYAQALFDYAKDESHLDIVNKDLARIEEAIHSSMEFNSFLTNPIISLEKRQNILNLLWKSRIEASTLRFLMFLAHKDRLSLLEDISRQYQGLYRSAKNILSVRIISSIALHKQQINKICQHLKSKLRKEIEPEMEVQKGLLGGVKIQVGDLMYDFSLFSQLEKFKNNVMRA